MIAELTQIPSPCPKPHGRPVLFNAVPCPDRVEYMTGLQAIFRSAAKRFGLFLCFSDNSSVPKEFVPTGELPKDGNVEGTGDGGGVVRQCQLHHSDRVVLQAIFIPAI